MNYSILFTELYNFDVIRSVIIKTRGQGVNFTVNQLFENHWLVQTSRVHTFHPRTRSDCFVYHRHKECAPLYLPWSYPLQSLVKNLDNDYLDYTESCGSDIIYNQTYVRNSGFPNTYEVST